MGKIASHDRIRAEAKRTQQQVERVQEIHTVVEKVANDTMTRMKSFSAQNKPAEELWKRVPPLKELLNTLPPPPAATTRIWIEAASGVDTEGHHQWTCYVYAKTPPDSDDTTVSTWTMTIGFQRDNVKVVEATGNPKWQAVNVDIKIPGEVTLTTAGMKSHVPKQKCRGARVHLATIVLRDKPELQRATTVQQIFTAARGDLLNPAFNYLFYHTTQITIRKINLPPGALPEPEALGVADAGVGYSTNAAPQQQPKSKARIGANGEGSLMVSPVMANLTGKLLHGFGGMHGGRLSEARLGVSSCAVGSLFLFAGGQGPLGRVVETVDIYDAKKREWRVARLQSPRKYISAVGTDSGKAFFGGGQSSPGVGGTSDVVDVYNSQRDTWSHIRLSQARMSLAGAAVLDTVVFGGGIRDRTRTGQFKWSDRVDIFDARSERLIGSGQLSVPRGRLAAVSLGSFILFAGGMGSNGVDATVDIFDTKSQTWDIGVLSQARQYLAAATSGNQAFFAGGYICESSPCKHGAQDRSDVVDVFDYDMITGRTKWKFSTLSEARSNLAGLSVSGRLAVFAGGTARADPSSFFADPECVQNCVAWDTKRHGREENQDENNKIQYATVKRTLRKVSTKPIGVRSYAVDVNMPGCRHTIHAELSQSRAGLHGSAMLDPGDPSEETILIVIGGGEIRTKWRIPTNLAGADYVSDHVDVLRAHTKHCMVSNLNTLKIFN
eukprot:CAMPEP_0114236512 /NCGR_PEP_ID=MMETSP0058-20121206/6882_1 /TAXON_ID=36894 /ORGANISM="Pyramimonas parkeae, CCMP726" /LENGTH=721 /DNA_ID=CAMNT_0001348463 /DNA_START=285 /DNA_END=2450 /DNA_ORIENTATION=+